MLRIRLHPLYEMDGAIGDSPSVEGTADAISTGDDVSTGTAPVQDEQETESSAESESSFARRLREHSEKAIKTEREKWEKEVSEKYSDYDTHKELSTYFQEVNGLDAMTLKERIELERLQERAGENEVSPEMQQRMESLEAKAAKADELEQQQQEEQRSKVYFDSMGKFLKGKQGTTEQLNQFMIENNLSYNPDNMEKSFNVAYRAMHAEQLEQELATAKETAVKEYLQSKTAPRVEGSGTPGIVQEDTANMSWTDIRQRTLARINAANQST